jgi:hypothetical protein
MKGYSRELVMVAVVAALMLAFTVQIRRAISCRRHPR